MMRTRDLTDPLAWRAWGGTTYDVALGVNPYTDPAVVPSAHTCVPFTKMTYPSLLWSSHYSKYMLFGTNQGADEGGWASNPHIIPSHGLGYANWRQQSRFEICFAPLRPSTKGAGCKRRLESMI